MRCKSAWRSPHLHRNLSMHRIQHHLTSAAAVTILLQTIIITLLPVFTTALPLYPPVGIDAINEKEEDIRTQQQSLRRQNFYTKRSRIILQDNETNSNGNDGKEQFTYAPLRIHFDTRLIDYTYSITNDALIKQEIDNVIDVILQQAAQIWGQHLYIQHPLGSGGSEITINQTNCDIDYELKNDTIVDLLFPNTTTYTDVDIVLMVGGDLRNRCKTRQLAYARACTLDVDTDRPIVGKIEFCFGGMTTSMQPAIYDIPLVPYYENFTGVKFNTDHIQIEMLDVTLHETAHVLGMSSLLFPYFRDENGLPRMERDNETGYPVFVNRTCGDGTISSEYDEVASEDIVSVVPMNDGTYQQYMITPTVRSVVRNHFNCSTLPGARLGDSSPLCISSHWHERDYYNDLMGPKASRSSVNSLSLLTFALLADTGWYHVDFRNLEQRSTSTFGMNAGCDFTSQPCIDNRTNQISDWVVDEFCDEPYLQLQALNETGVLKLLNQNIYCDPGYRSWTLCDLVQYDDGTIPNRTYFTSQQWGPLNFTEADFCPIPAVGLGLDCGIDTQSTYSTFYPGERVGDANSRCINGFYNQNSSNGIVMITSRPACMVVTCNVDAGIVQIGEGVHVQNCTFDGERLPLPGRSDDASLICPRLAVVCPTLFACPDSCFGKGDCIHSTTSGGRYQRPYCSCFNETNTDPSCAPSMFASMTLSDNNSTATESPTVVPTESPTRSTKSPTAPMKSPTLPTPVVTTAPYDESVPLSIPSPTITSNSNDRISNNHILGGLIPSIVVVLLILYSATFCKY